MTFELTRKEFVQTHFSVIEIDVPTVNAGFGTPLSSDGTPSTELTTYSFTDFAGILPKSNVWKCVSKVSETTTKLQPGKGLAARGTASIKLIDFKGDPNPFAPLVTGQVKLQGTYFGKLDSRNVLTNRDCRIINYRIGVDGVVDLTAGETRHYIVDSFDGSSKGVWTLKLKDELSRINFGDSIWPIEQKGYLRTDIDDTTTTLLVDPNIYYEVNNTIRIGDELLKIVGISGMGTGSATLTVAARGSDITYANTLSKTDKDEHSLGDEVVLCVVSDNQPIEELLEKILTDVGIKGSLIPIGEWNDEVDEWLAGIKVNTLWIESESTNDVLAKILTYYMLDMWFDPVARQVKLSAINVWKQSSSVLTEGVQIDYESIKSSKNENLRATRALVVYDKRYLARSESIENYNKGSLFTRPELEVSDLYGKSKVKHFEFSFVIDGDAADLLVNRWVNRYINPVNYSWSTQERMLTFNVGDIVDLDTSVDVGFDGLPSTKARGQVLSIQPKYTDVGREYTVTALTYEPVFTENTEIVITGNISNVNLYTQYAGAPSSAVNITFIFDGAKLSGTSNSIPAMQAGSFPAGSKVIIIMINGAELLGKGGNGGEGESILYNEEISSWERFDAGNGIDGGIVYDAQGVNTDIYFSGPTSSATYTTADGYILSPSGGSGGLVATFTSSQTSGRAGDGGNAGDGSLIGVGGLAGQVLFPPSAPSENGIDGTSSIASGNFGRDGVDNAAIKGLSGSGVIDSGALVNFFGETPVRYINGRGDH